VSRGARGERERCEVETAPAAIPAAPADGGEDELEDRPAREPYSSPCSMALDPESAASEPDRSEPD